MKTIVKGAMRDEKGKVLIMVLILLVLGGLILTPLLGLMSTGLASGQVYEKKTHEYYAADAGIECGIWTRWILNSTSIESFESNNCDVTVNITDILWNDIPEETRDAFDLTQDDFVYFVKSTASSSADSSTTMECYVVLTTYITCDPSLGEWEDYSGSGDIYGGNTVVEPGGMVDGNIAEGANVWNEGGMSTTGNVEKWSTVNINGDAYFTGTGNIVDGATLFVFGNCEIAGDIKLSEVYISGNLTLNGNIQESHVYVGGNLISEESSSTNIQNSTVYVGGDLIIPGSIDSGSTVMVESDLVVGGKITADCYYYYGGTLDAEVEAGATEMSLEDMLTEKAALEEQLNNLLCPLEKDVGVPQIATIEIT